MHSSEWWNGTIKYHRVGQTSQVTPQLISDMTRIQSAEASSRYMQVSTGVSPPSVRLTGHGGAFNGVTSDWQTSTVPQQAVSSQQAATGVRDNICHSNSVFGSKALQSSFTKSQNGNHIWPVKFICAPQVGTQQSFQQKHTQIQSNQSPPNVTIQSHPLPGYVNKSTMRRDGNFVADFQHLQAQNLNVVSAQSLSASAATASTTAYNRQAAQNQNYSSGYRQIYTQYGLPPAKPPPPCTSVSQHWRNNSIAANSANGQCVSSMGQITCNGGREATNCSNFATANFLLKTNQQPSKASIGSAAGTGQHLHSQQRIQRLAGSHCQSLTVGSDGHPQANSGKQFSTEGRMTDYRTGQPLPHTNHVTVQQNLEHPPQQSSVLNGFCGTVTGDRGENGFTTGNATFLRNNLTQSCGYLTINALSRLQQLSEGRSEGSSSLSGVEVPEMVSVKPNDSNIHASPGRSGQRAVAVVQPLSQETCQTARKHVTSDDVNPLCKRIREEEEIVSVKAINHKNITSQAVRIKKKKNTVKRKLQSSDSAGSEHSSPKQPCADDTASELSSNIRSDHCAEPAAPQSVTTSHPNASLELSSIAIICWRMDKLSALIKETSKAQGRSNDNKDYGNDFDVSKKLLDMFWDGSCKNLASLLKTGWYKDLIIDVNEFCSKQQIASDTIILLQAQHRSLFEDNRFHITKHDEVYQEVPYTSSWLNINEQLDDIDKEFGFPWSLKYSNQTVESDSRPELIEKADDFPVQCVNEKQNVVLPQTEPEAAEPDNEKQKSGVADTSAQPPSPTSGVVDTPIQPPSPTSGVVDTPIQPPSPTSGVVDTPIQPPSPTSGVVDTPIQPPSPNKLESTDFSDPHYSFEIQVLPPEEAKLIFERSKIPQSTKTGSQPDNFIKIQVLLPEEAKLIFEQSTKTESQSDKLMNGSVEDELPEILDVSFSEAILENGRASAIEQFCCIKRWMEIISGLNKSLLCKCQCKQQISLNDSTVKKLDHTEKPEEEEEMCVIQSECKLHLTSEDNKADETMIFSWPEECPTKIIDLTEDDIPQSNDDMEPMNVSLLSIDGDKSSSVVISGNPAENLFSSENTVAIQLSDLEGDCEQGQRKSAESSQPSSSDNDEKEIENEITSQMSDIEDREQAQQKSTDMSESNSSTSFDLKELSTRAHGSQTSAQVDLTSTDSADGTPLKTEHQTEVSQRDDSFESNCTSSETFEVSHIVSSPSELGNIHSSAFKMAFGLKRKCQSFGIKRRLSGPDRFFPSDKNLRKLKSSDVPDSQPAPKDNSNSRTVVAHPDKVRSVELSLFGSGPLKKQILISGQKSHISLQKTYSTNQASTPPETLTVLLSPVRRLPPETILKGEYSVKQLIHEKWRRSIPPSTITYTSKCLKRKFKSEIGLKKVDSIGPRKTVFPVSFGKWKRKVTKQSRSRSRRKRESNSNGSKHGVQVKRDATFKQSDDEEGSHAENGNNDILPLQENNILRFSVLPNTFNFKDEAIKRHDADKPELVDAKDKSSNTDVKTPTGAWTQNPENKYRPVQSPVRKNSVLFNEFQKKYKQKAQPVTDD